MSIQQTAQTAQASLRDFEDSSVIQQIERMDKPYQSERVLRAMYWGAAMSLREIANRFGVEWWEVQRWMRHHDIETRSRKEGVQLRQLREGDGLFNNSQSGSFEESGSSDTPKWSFQD